MVMNKVFEFIYNSDCCESVARTVSIHKTKKGAEMAMEFHKAEVKYEHEELYKDFESDTEWDWDQYWDIRETLLDE